MIAATNMMYRRRVSQSQNREKLMLPSYMTQVLPSNNKTQVQPSRLEEENTAITTTDDEATRSKRRAQEARDFIAAINDIHTRRNPPSRLPNERFLMLDPHHGNNAEPPPAAGHAQTSLPTGGGGLLLATALPLKEAVDLRTLYTRRPSVELPPLNAGAHAVVLPPLSSNAAAAAIEEASPRKRFTIFKPKSQVLR
jgi:hypothetical protein